LKCLQNESFLNFERWNDTPVAFKSHHIWSAMLPIDWNLLGSQQPYSSIMIKFSDHLQ
jgi:hypothetical protein